MEFACKNFDLDRIIRCGLSLTKADFRILEFLMKNPKKKIDTNLLSRELNLDLSTVQRALKKMYEQQLVKRSQINLPSGGYSFVYYVCDKKEVKGKVKRIIKEWTDKFDLEINRW